MVKRLAWFIIAAIVSGIIYALVVPKWANDWLTDHQLAVSGSFSWVTAALEWVRQPQSTFWIMVAGSVLILLGSFFLPSDGDEDTNHWLLAIIVLTTALAVGYRLIFGSDSLAETDSGFSDPAVIIMIAGYGAVLLLMMTDVRIPGRRALKKRLSNEDYRYAKWKSTGDYTKDESRLICLCERAPNPATHKCPPGYVAKPLLIEAHQRPFLTRLFGRGMPKDEHPDRWQSSVSYLVNDPYEEPPRPTRASGHRFMTRLPTPEPEKPVDEPPDVEEAANEQLSDEQPDGEDEGEEGKVKE